jgi:hypothetical protein
LPVADSDLVSAIGSITSGAVAIIAAAVAYFAWRTSVNSAEATRALTRIEETRLHAEMRPQLDVSVERFQGEPENTTAILRVRLVGPPTLVQLESVKVTVWPVLMPVRAGGEWTGANEPNWPYLFTKVVPAEEPFERVAGPFGLMQRQQHVEFMGTPQESEWMLTTGMDEALFIFTCSQAGYEPWVIPIRVKIPLPKYAVAVIEARRRPSVEG